MTAPVPPTGDLSPDAFRHQAHAAVDWIADYLERLDDLPVIPPVEPGDVRAKIPDHAPEEGEPFEALLADLDRVIVPGMTHWGHPRFHAWFTSSGSAPGIVAEAIAAAFNPNCMTWVSSPAGTELEQAVVGWLRGMLGLPETFWGIVNEGASLNSLLGLAAARESAGLEIRERGMAGRDDLPRLRVYRSEHAHSSIDKAALTLGFGVEGIRAIETDEEFRMIPEALEEAIVEDRAEGWRPVCVVGTVGTTSTTSVDPIPAIADVCEREEIWLHVDAAHGGAAAIVPERRHVLEGCERADSLVVNPHKWMFVPLGASVLWVRRPEILERAFSLVPAYLEDARGETVTNYMNYGVTLGRRFQALKLWFVFRAFGREGLARRIREHLEIAGDLAGWIDDDPRFERVAPVPFSTVCFRAKPPGGESSNAYNERLLEAIDEGGRVFLTHTVLDGAFTIRLVVSGIRTTADDVREAWEWIRAVDARLSGESGEP